MKIIAVCLGMLLAVCCVLASSTDMDTVCEARGFEFGVAKWQRDNITDTFFRLEELEGYSTTLVGNESWAAWTADPAILGVVSKEGKIVYQVLPGGEFGGFHKKGNVPINYVTFCGNSTLQDEEQQVPEFGSIAAIFILVAGIGIISFRRK